MYPETQTTALFEKFERDFTTCEKLRALAYHCYQCTAGAIVDPKEHELYMDCFAKFVAWRKAESEKEATAQEGYQTDRLSPKDS